MKSRKSTLKSVASHFFLTISLLLMSGVSSAEVDWFAFTMDNDSLSGSGDDGYTNGVFFTWFDTEHNNKPEQGFLSRAMSWSLPNKEEDGKREVNINTIGQTMMTPSDITVEDPPLNDLPYAGLLFYNNSFVRSYEDYADKINVTLGVVGELSLAEHTQKAVHKITGSDEPKGWDTQLDNELVFNFGRSRIWRSWVLDEGSFEFLTGLDAQVGTIQSSAGASFMIRYGANLQRTYTTSMLSFDRTANPIAIEGGWYTFLGARAGYIANWIFLDGNTYEDSRDIDGYKREKVSVTAGIAYSWQDFALTWAVNDLNILVDDDEDELEELTRYGSLTFTWKAF